MKQSIFGWISAFIGIVLALAAIELAAIAWMSIEDGRYTPAAQLFERTQNTYVRDATRGTTCRYVDTLYPHPYVGFVHHANPPCGQPWVNNIGMYGADYPTVRDPERYTVILTGGSVASSLAQNEKPPAPRYLEEELNKKYVSPNGKPWLVLNGGDGAWKEPQPFILFSLYASSIDALVNLGGYNEHWSFRWQERLERPASNFIEVSPFVADENFGDAAIGWVMGRLAGALAAMPVLGHSHAAYMMVRGIEQAAKAQDTVKSSKKTTMSSIFRIPEEIRRDPERTFGVQLGLYQKYLRATEALARDYNINSAYFLQPVPAYGKALTKDEKRVVGDLSYGPLYRKIVAGMLTLTERGLPIYDLGDIFSNEKGTLYADDIHSWRDDKFESPGNRMMATAIADHLAQTWGLQKK